jgi:hypothetical protein
MCTTRLHKINITYMAQPNFTKEEIAAFLEGKDSQEYIVNIEAPYHIAKADLIINDPVKGKYIQSKSFKPFLWLKEEAVEVIYEGNRKKIKMAAKKYGVKFKTLRTTDDSGFEPVRLRNGYKYLAETKQCYSSLINFFRQGGVDIYSEQYRHLFMAITPVEQFMIQTGKRLFKGIDDYDNLHRFQFDLETEGLDPKTQRIFQIGMRDNRGFEEIIEVAVKNLKKINEDGIEVDKTDVEIEAELDELEREAIRNIFKVIDILKPDVITGYNSENFDWEYFEIRCEVLGMELKNVVRTLDVEKGTFRRKESRLKLGGDTEQYKQAIMWGYSILDIWHAVRKAKAINSEIKKTSLKYITTFAKAAKPNRVYVPGDLLHTTWADEVNTYYLNDTDGDWFKYIDPTSPDNADIAPKLINEQTEKINSGDYSKVTGAYIVQRYLKDDLWETEKVDSIFNQATFLVSKILPTTFMKSATMGTAGTWKLIMMSWSYENGLALPALEPKREFTGGLARLMEVGFAKRVCKLDYAALYPNIELTHDIFPDLDITGVMEGLLFYIVDQRDTFKFLKNDHDEMVDKTKALLKADPTNKELLEELKKHEYLKSMYDKKQLPLKILANSFFGSFGASYLFNWGDVNCAEETTCRGRQYLRLMVRHFYEKYGFKPLVGDSVTYDTPIYIRYKENHVIDIKPICDIFNENSEVFDEEGLRDFEEKPYEVLTVNGWRDIQYTYRHETDKKIHRVTTKDRLVQVTEDHSLFQNGVQVKPSTLKQGDSLDVYNLPHHNEGTLPDERKDMFWLLGYFLGDGSAIYGPRKQYYKSRKTGEVHVNKGVRGEWKISSNNLENLERLKTILEKEFWNWGVKPKIKDHRKSSGVYNLVVYKTDFSERFCEDFYTSYREKKVPTCVLNTTLENKRAFMDGVCASDGYGDCMDTVSDIGMKSQVAMSGIGYLLNCLGVDYKVKTRKDKENFISFKLRNRNRNNSGFTDKTIMQTDEVWKNDVIQNRDKNKYVYDISTEDGTFIGGIGAINLKNTDGFNFAIPDSVDEISYYVKGTHRLTEKNKGKTLTGLDAVVADFNEEYMIGRMGLDIDDICESTINFSRKNYGNLIKGKVKLVGNTIKSSKMAGYIEDFMGKGVSLLLDDKGKEFIDLYYETVDKIFNYQIPLAKMASKSKVNQTLEDYAKYCKGKNKAGNLNSRKAFMELLIQHGIKPNLGDVVYYYNTGSAKSHGDLKTIKKDGKIVDVELQCKLIPTSQLEKNPDLTTDEYNVAKYLENINKRIKPLLVCFDKEIRDKITITTKKNRKTKEIELTDRHYFTAAQCKLVSGQPYEMGDQDSYNALMTLDDKEIRFWTSVNKVPNNMELSEWEEIKADYFERLEIARLNSIRKEKEALTEIFKGLKVTDFSNVFSQNIIPPSILKYVDLKPILNNDNKLVAIEMVSRKHNERLCLLSDMFEWEPYAILRQEFYNTLDVKMPPEEMLEKWDEYETHIKFSEGEDVFQQKVEEKRVEGRPIKAEVDKIVNELDTKEEVEIPTVETVEVIEEDTNDVVETTTEDYTDEDDEVINF